MSGRDPNSPQRNEENLNYGGIEDADSEAGGNGRRGANSNDYEVPEINESVRLTNNFQDPENLDQDGYYNVEREDGDEDDEGDDQGEEENYDDEERDGIFADQNNPSPGDRNQGNFDNRNQYNDEDDGIYEDRDEYPDEEDYDNQRNGTDPNTAGLDGGENEEDEEDIQNLNYEVFDPDEDDDFPEYANEANKKLNENIKQEKRTIKIIDSKIEDLNERLLVLREHYKNIKQELKNTQALIDVKNKETETEKHLSMVAERQIGRINKELQKCDNIGIEEQDRLNDIQQQIFKGNEKLDKYKLEINFHQEEMDQWALAAKQKEEDNLTLERYKRADEMKIKELSLQLEKLTIEKNKKEVELEKEVTQTQALQIEIDKTAAEFKKQHEERHKIFSQWDETIQQIEKRHRATLQAGEEMAKIKMEMKSNQAYLDERKRHLDEERNKNKNIQVETQNRQRAIAQLKEINTSSTANKLELDAEVKIFQNRLSASSSELAKKKNEVFLLQKELLVRKERLTHAEQKFKAQSSILKNEIDLDQTLKEMNDEAQSKYDKLQERLERKDKDIRVKKDEYFKAQQKLFKLRENEANLYSDIQGTMAALRNLQSHINKLHQELARQQELLYNAEYQIQLLERKVARANGERTNKEAKQLQEETEKVEDEKKKIKDLYDQVDDALKQLADEKRNLERRVKQKEEEREKLIKNIEKFNLENDMTLQELKKIVKNKEDAMVSHDIMKLEIKKIQDRLNDAQNEVLGLENKKNQLELSMGEREKEISVHNSVLTAEYKAAEKERHKTAVELAERENKVRNLKIKYESLIQRKQGSEATNVHEHSQAYYIIKAAQEKEELQRKEDELKAKILKSEKELTSLVNTLTHLNNRNQNYRDYFINKGATQMDLELQNNLEDQCKVASDNLMNKRRDFDKIKMQIESHTEFFNEKQSELESILSRKEQIQIQQQQIDVTVVRQQDQLKRADNFYRRNMKAVQNLALPELEESKQFVQANLDSQRNLTKSIYSVIHTLYEDYPEVANIMDMYFKEEGVELPQQAPSTIGVDSLSRGSGLSKPSSNAGSEGRNRQASVGSSHNSQGNKSSNGNFRIQRQNSAQYSRRSSARSSQQASLNQKQ